jgi:hypothetical protein
MSLTSTTYTIGKRKKDTIEEKKSKDEVRKKRK